MDVASEDKTANLSLPRLTEKQLEDLQWAKEFMDKYEKHKRGSTIQLGHDGVRNET